MKNKTRGRMLLSVPFLLIFFGVSALFSGVSHIPWQVSIGMTTVASAIGFIIYYVVQKGVDLIEREDHPRLKYTNKKEIKGTRETPHTKLMQTEDLIIICKDRIDALQKGPLVSNENAQVLYHLNLTLKYLTGKEVNFGDNS